MLVFGKSVVGHDVDSETRCAHYNTERDVIAVKFPCCNTYFPCFKCHAELAGHPAAVWPAHRFDEKAVLCGVCGTELTVREYLTCDFTCPRCKASFNPGCKAHYDLYFAVND